MPFKEQLLIVFHFSIYIKHCGNNNSPETLPCFQHSARTRSRKRKRSAFHLGIIWKSKHESFYDFLGIYFANMGLSEIKIVDYNFIKTIAPLNVN